MPALQGLASVVARMDAATLVAVADADGTGDAAAVPRRAGSATVLPFERRVS